MAVFDPNEIPDRARQVDIPRERFLEIRTAMEQREKELGKQVGADA